MMNLPTSSSSSSTDFIATLMSNNDKAREQVLSLSKEVSRLKKREFELCNHIQQFLKDHSDITEEDKMKLIEWLLNFLSEDEEGDKTKKSSSSSSTTTTTTEEEDRRSKPYILMECPPETIQKLFRMADELKLLTRIKTKAVLPWLENNRQISTLDEIRSWENTHKVQLPRDLIEFYQKFGGRNIFSDEDDSLLKVSTHTYSPFLSLVPLSHLGWTEVWGVDEEEVEEEQVEMEPIYSDDTVVISILDRCEAGHELDDAFVCEQLTGGENDKKTKKNKMKEKQEVVRVLLIGCPLEVKLPNGNQVNSRMFLNIRSKSESSDFVGNGLLYRLDSSGEEGDSELVKIGTFFDWIQTSFMTEFDDRLRKGDPSDFLAKRYPKLVEEGKKRMKAATEGT